MRLLDLFCGAGGAAMGYYHAGFDEIVGVDIKPQPRYPFEFVQGDALEYLSAHGAEFDFVHASPPCQGYSTMANRFPQKKAEYPKLIPDVREGLDNLGKPYVIENVMGARREMVSPVRLCGTGFGLRVARHRIFESNFDFPPNICECKGRDIVGVYGQRPDGRRLNSRAVRRIQYAAASLQDGSDAMGIDWMEWRELTQAIPPAYTEWIGRQYLATQETA